MPLSEAQTEIILGKTRPLLEKRDFPKTACPSEIARALSRQELDSLGAESWREAMEDIRQVVFTLRDNGEVEILQKKQVVDDSVTPESVHGPIRVRMVRRAGAD
jgi:hypothetical protein